MNENISIDNITIGAGNKLIANFLGYEYVASNAPDREPLIVNGYTLNYGYWRRQVRGMDGIVRSLSDGFKLIIHRPKLEFHNDWEDLIRIVSYIERIPQYDAEFIITKTGVQLSVVPTENRHDKLNIKLLYKRNRVSDRMDTLWKSIVWFCQYHKERQDATSI